MNVKLQTRQWWSYKLDESFGTLLDISRLQEGCKPPIILL